MDFILDRALIVDNFVNAKIISEDLLQDYLSFFPQRSREELMVQFCIDLSLLKQDIYSCEDKEYYKDLVEKLVKILNIDISAEDQNVIIEYFSIQQLDQSKSLSSELKYKYCYNLLSDKILKDINSNIVFYFLYSLREKMLNILLENYLTNREVISKLLEELTSNEKRRQLLNEKWKLGNQIGCSNQR